MDLSIILVNWNSGILLEKCLDSVYNTLKGLNFEVFVIDNGSSDKSLDCLKLFHSVNFIQNKQNLGFSKANNIAIKKSKGDYILLLNPDTILLDNSIKRMVSCMVRNQDIGVLGCRLLNQDKTIQPSCHAFLTLSHVFFEVSQIDRVFPKNNFFISLFRPFNKSKLFMNYSTPNQVIEVESVMGSCYMIRKSALNKTGLLDENFFLYHEEMELSYRMRKKGYKVVFYPYSSIIHQGKYSVNMVPDSVYLERCKSILHFFKKHKKKQLKFAKFVMFGSVMLNTILPFRKKLGSRIDALKLCF